VGSLTRLHVLLLHAYALSAAALAAGAAVRAVARARERLAELNAGKRRIAKDADWLARAAGGPSADERKPSPQEMAVCGPFDCRGSEKATGPPILGYSVYECLDGSAASGARCLEVGRVCGWREPAAPPPKLAAGDGAAGPDWGGGPVPMFFGLGQMTNSNADVWASRAAIVDRFLRVLLPGACAVSLMATLASGRTLVPWAEGGAAASPLEFGF
jgi:hypothetical protein